MIDVIAVAGLSLIAVVTVLWAAGGHGSLNYYQHDVQKAMRRQAGRQDRYGTVKPIRNEFVDGTRTSVTPRQLT
jgi:hypothetical protein